MVSRKWFCDLLKVSTVSELNSPSLSIEAPESISNVRSSLSLAPFFHKRIKRSFIRIFELVDISAKSYATLRGASSSLQRFVLCSFLKSGSARVALMRFTLLNVSSRWTLSFPSFDVVPRALGEFEGVI